MSIIDYKQKHIDKTEFFVKLLSILIVFINLCIFSFEFIYFSIVIATTIRCGVKSGIIVSSVPAFIITLTNIIRSKLLLSDYSQIDFILLGVFILTTLMIGAFIKLKVEVSKKKENTTKTYESLHQNNDMILDSKTNYNSRIHKLELISNCDSIIVSDNILKTNGVNINLLEENKIEDKIIIDDELSTLVKILADSINTKDKNTYGHTERVVMYSKIMAESLKLSKKDKEILIYGAYMHDIGKINTNSEILTKQTKLTEDEWNEIKRHPAEGAEMIKCVGALQEVVPLIRSHHERYDGNGYPNNLKGEEIPYLARVITVIDSFDAITSKRPYNDGKTYDEGIEELKRCSGTQFDPEIVKVFIEEFTNNVSLFSMVNRKNYI